MHRENPNLTALVDPESPHLTAAQVAALLNVSARTVHRCASDGRLPRPIKVANRLSRWPRETIAAWLRTAAL
jgi:excisionase family DNA binding protein